MLHHLLGAAETERCVEMAVVTIFDPARPPLRSSSVAKRRAT